MLGIVELAELEDELKAELEERFTEILTRLNRNEQLEDLLQLLGLENLLQKSSEYEVYKNGKIIVIGGTEAKENDLLGIVKKLGLDKNRFEFYLNYNNGKKFNFKKMQWNPKYSLILVGPMGHSGISKGNGSSVISSIEISEGYPPVVRMGSNDLKITKSNFELKLSELISMGKIA